MVEQVVRFCMSSSGVSSDVVVSILHLYQFLVYLDSSCQLLALSIQFWYRRRRFVNITTQCAVVERRAKDSKRGIADGCLVPLN